jgi:hypothetical protein
VVQHDPRRIRSKALLPFGAALVLAACTTSTRQSVQSPVPLPQAPPPQATGTQVSQRDAILWSSTRRLAWSDYRARPAMARDQVAVSATSLLWGFHCTDADLEVQVAAAFFPNQSWVNSGLLLSTDQHILQHERTHFDLAEVFARRMRRFFRMLPNPCEHTDDDLKLLGESFVQEEDAAQARYDLETSHGEDETAQARWDLFVSQLLKSLAEFKRPDLPFSRPLLWRDAR